MVPSLLGLKDSILCKSPSSDYYLLGFSENEGRAYIQYYSAKNVLGLAIRLDKDDALLSTFSKLYEEVGVSIMLDGEGKAYVNPSDASKPAIAASGDWVTLISEAAVEAGDTTLRISWENSDEQLLKIFECNKDPEMLRIEDDGLKLVRIDDPETVYFLR